MLNLFFKIVQTLPQIILNSCEDKMFFSGDGEGQEGGQTKM